MKQLFTAILTVSAVIIFAANCYAGPFGIFGRQSAAGSCANGQCVAPTSTVTTARATATPTANGTGQIATASAFVSGSCGQQSLKIGPVRRLVQRWRHRR